MEFHPLLWAAAALPLAAFLGTLLGLRWEVYRSGALALALALATGVFFFGGDHVLISLALSKGFSLSLFFLIFIWAAVFFYNLVLGETGASVVVGRSVSTLLSDPLAQGLLLAWCLSGFFEGIVGFGVPVIVVSPFLVTIGFRPLKAVAMALVGHAWAVSYGPLGMAYYGLEIITGLPGDSLKIWLSIMMAAPIILSGAAVAHIFGGREALKRSLPLVLPVGTVMAAAYIILPQLGAEALNALASGIIGAAVLFLLKGLWKSRGQELRSAAQVREGNLTLGTALFPLILLITLALVLQLSPLGGLLESYSWGLSYPSFVTDLGYRVSAESMYAAINPATHPAPLLLLAALVGGAYLLNKGLLVSRSFQEALKITSRQALPTSLSLLTLILMALVMNDMGMTTLLAEGVVIIGGSFYPAVVPLVGSLGSFLTGSNNSSNVLLGIFQKEAALSLGVSPLIMVSAHSIGGGLASAITPAKVLLGASALGLQGEENRILGITARYSLGIAAFAGLLTWLFVHVFFVHIP